MADSERLLQDGINALKAGQRHEARQLLSEAVKANPKSEWGWIYLAALLPPAEAISALERAVKINPKNPQAREGLLVLRSQATKAIEQAEEDNQTKGRGLSNRIRRTKTDKKAEAELDYSGNTDLLAPLTINTNLRSMLNQPYALQSVEPKRGRLWPIFLWLGLMLVALAALATAYFVVVDKAAAPSANLMPVTALPSPALADSPAVTSPLPAVFTSQPNPGFAPPPMPDPTKTLPALPTPILPTNLRVVQSERAELKAYTLIFSGYDNRSGNFASGGAGAPRSGRHFEGVQLQLENRFNRVLAVPPEAFQALDGRNNYVSPLTGGRLPALDVARLQPGEIRSAWLTFEVEDGTTLRRLVFSGPTPGPDSGNTVEVNLILPAATPGPIKVPTKAPTAVPVPTSTRVPTATPVPTNTAVPSPTQPAEPAATATLVPGTNVPQLATVGATAPALVFTAPAPATTVPPLPTATVPPTALPTATPVAPTATAIPPSPTPANTEPPGPTSAPKAEMKQRYTLGTIALTVTEYVKEPKAKPVLQPAGYHYEAVKISLESLETAANEAALADFISTYPFYLRDGEGRVYTVGPLTQDSPDRFDPKKLLTASGTTATTKKAATPAPVRLTSTGLLYFLVRDSAKPARTFIFYSTKEVDSARIEVALK